ncbi:putative T7SS-secreted protein [Streptomyces clavifer]|uniref:putative T7SS-secreted protein n=1 Tax=Streptomyces TaxID=1883 RepID=UPI0029A2243F|nr:polymorphic toxin type 28 domain-containing protein [Streptomyces sp. ND04-05B]MDX3065515.1 polymorphic toxin type 28 domain-containing protein [Streptomyces sp. ND04-05B]
MVDWGKLGGDLYDGAGNLVDKGKEIVGTGIDKGTDALGSGLEKVGADQWADAVEDWGDETASSLGAEVGEQQLGQTEEANELIHGRPEKIAAAVKNLRDFQRAFDLVGGGMKRLDSAHWKGVAADTFREKFQTLPTDWLRAADAFEDAAAALETYAGTVTSAQSKAGEAIALYKEGKQDRVTAAAAFKEKAEAYNAVRNTDHPLPHPGKFSDPGVVKRRHAQEILERARRARNEAAEAAKGAVTAAMAHAPKEPTGLDKAKQEFYDYGVGQSIELAHVGGGVIKGTAGLLNFVRSVYPLDPYNLTHPAEYYKGVNTTLAGLVSTAANPDRALKNAWGAAKGDPSEFIGRLLPELVGTKGGGVLKGLARHGLKDGAESAARKGVDDPAKSSKPDKGVEKDPTDPVDLATGTMYLPQTDIALPGTLPLVFRRRVASDYRAGRWFGPSWSSTADQRLEIDSQGIVLVCEDGLLLSYPHPAPGVPVTPSHGPRWPLDVDTAGDYTITDPDNGRIRHFSPRTGDLALLVQIDDRNGNWIQFEYDETGAPAGIVHGGGYHLKLTTSEGRITALHLAGAAPDGSDQEILRYRYTDGHLTEVINSSGLPLRFAYDDRGRVTSWTDTNDSRYDYAYDGRDRCIAEGGAAGHMALRLDYDGIDPESGMRVTTVTSSSGAVHRYVINDSHQVAAEIDPLGATTRFERDRYNRLLSRTDPLGRTNRFAYDESGQVTSAVRPDGRELSVEYNDFRLPVRVTNPDRTVVRQEYDERGNRLAVTDPSGAVTRTIYNEAGHATSVTDALGDTTHIRSDQAGLPLRVTDPLGATTQVARDAFGRPVTLTDPLGAVTCLEWTVEGKLSRRTDADGTTQSWTYDGEGNCLTHTDAMGAVSRFEYTHFDLMTARTGPDGVRYEFAHDHELRLTQVLNPQGLTWNYSYDAAGHLISETDFDNRTLAYDRDMAGRLTARTDALGQTTRYERDELDRIVSKDAAGAVTTFAYDLSDQLAEAVNADATLTYLRDRYGRLVSETVNGRTMTYEYDRLGRRTGRTTPSGAVSTWTYDAAGRRTSLTTSGRVLTFEHDAAGQETARHIGDTLNLANQYDCMGRLTTQHITGRDNRSIQRRDYTYRADGHLTGLADQLSGTKTFELDPAGRVTSVQAAGWTERYAYDQAGNQTEASWPRAHPGQEAVGTREYTGTIINRSGKVRYEHDPLGRTTLCQRTRLSRKPDTWRYEWDAEDRMRSATTPDGVVWRYQYDALGRRTAKQRVADDGCTLLEHVAFTWDGITLCEEVTKSEVLCNPVALTWEHQGLYPLTQTERIIGTDSSQDAINERFFSIATNMVGAPTELVDEAGDIAWHARNTLWGTTAWAAKSKTYTPLRFLGQYYDVETGLHYNLRRYYAPESGRYLTSDPLGLLPAVNPYIYVQNPTTWADPLGLAPYEGLGLSRAAQLAFEKLENIKRDPLGEINSQPNHNHYDAARREARGEVVARKPDGTPFDHISDLQQARNGLDKIRKVIDLEIRSIPDSLTDRGLEVLLVKRSEVNKQLNELNGFLHSIGHR